MTGNLDSKFGVVMGDSRKGTLKKDTNIFPGFVSKKHKSHEKSTNSWKGSGGASKGHKLKKESVYIKIVRMNVCIAFSYVSLFRMYPFFNHFFIRWMTLESVGRAFYAEHHPRYACKQTSY